MSAICVLGRTVSLAARQHNNARQSGKNAKRDDFFDSNERLQASYGFVRGPSEVPSCVAWGAQSTKEECKSKEAWA